MKLISIFFFMILYSFPSFGNRLLFPNQRDFTIESYSWICQVLNFNYKNSCLAHSNYIRRSIKVGFLDTGFNKDLHIFKSYNINNGYNVYDKNSNISDTVGHGTQTVSVFIDTLNRIESIIGESIPFEITPIKISDNAGKINSLQLIRGYFYLASYLKVDIINLSVSGSEYSLDEKQAFQYGSKNSSSVLVAAAGNEILNLDKVNSYPCSYQSPNMICVGSTTILGTGLISNYGYDVDILISGEKVRVVQKEGNFNRINGSSFSAPQITAYIAYALYRNPNLTYDKIKSMIIDSSYDKTLGAGKTTCLFSKSCGVFSFSKFNKLVLESL